MLNTYSATLPKKSLDSQPGIDGFVLCIVEVPRHKCLSIYLSISFSA